MLSVQDVRTVCAALPHSQETFPFGETTLVLKVAGKMYALTALDSDPVHVSVKVRPDDGEALRAEHPAITPGHHLNKRHWVTLTLDGSLPSDLPADLIRGSYQLVLGGLTRAQRSELGL